MVCRGQGALKRHMSRHMTLEFACNECPRSYASERSLVRHIATHRSQGAFYDCPHCDKRMRWKANLTSHLKSCNASRNDQSQATNDVQSKTLKDDQSKKVKDTQSNVDHSNTLNDAQLTDTSGDKSKSPHDDQSNPPNGEQSKDSSGVNANVEKGETSNVSSFHKYKTSNDKTSKVLNSKKSKSNISNDIKPKTLGYRKMKIKSKTNLDFSAVSNPGKSETTMYNSSQLTTNGKPRVLIGVKSKRSRNKTISDSIPSGRTLGRLRITSKEYISSSNDEGHDTDPDEGQALHLDGNPTSDLGRGQIRSPSQIAQQDDIADQGQNKLPVQGQNIDPDGDQLPDLVKGSREVMASGGLSPSAMTQGQYFISCSIYRVYPIRSTPPFLAAMCP